MLPDQGKATELSWFHLAALPRRPTTRSPYVPLPDLLTAGGRRPSPPRHYDMITAPVPQSFRSVVAAAAPWPRRAG